MAKTTKQMTFGDLKRGDKFSLSEGGVLNMKVALARICDESGEPSTKVLPFNVVSLEDGRPRMFRDDWEVWVEG